MNEMFIPSMNDFNQNEEELDELIVALIFYFTFSVWDNLHGHPWTGSWIKDDFDWDDFYGDSGTRRQWDNAMKSTAQSVNKKIDDLYNFGRRAAYREVGQDMGYTLADREALLFLKNYNFDLIRSLSDDLRGTLKVVLSDSLKEGLSLDETAQRIMNAPLLPVPGSNVSVRTRARMIARTEHARAINNGVLQAYANLGVEKVDIITAGDNHVCKHCISLAAGNPYPIGKAQSLLPAHPNCRCSFAAHKPAFKYNPPSNPNTVSLVDPKDRRGDEEYM